MERSLTLIALFAALIAALGLIPKLTLGFGVPITAQTLGVMLCGTILGARKGALAVLLFLALVLLGLPLLAGGRGGLGVLSTPSVGFLIGWPIGAYVTGFIVERFRSVPVGIVAGAASVVGCVVVIYLFGIAGVMRVNGSDLVPTTLAMMAFVPGDLIKAVIAGLVTAGLAQARPASVLSRR